MTEFLDKVDACIVGSGAGGAVVAKELGEKGVKVVVLEAGRRFDPLRDYPTANQDWEIYTERYPVLFNVPSLQKITLSNRYLHRPHQVNGVGGGTLQYLAYAIRMRPDDFRVYSVDGVGLDWPISYEDLEPYYRKVELELGVSGKTGAGIPPVEHYPNPPFEFSYANKIIKRGCDKLAINLRPAAMARLSQPFDGRPKCVNCGGCTRGCMSGAKSSVDVTYIRKAEATGNVVVRPQRVVTRIKADSEGRAKSVIYFDENGIEHEQHADVIIISAGTIQSPRLLLNSKSKQFPDGLANRNGLVGKYFMQHFGMGSAAIFPERIDSFRGFYGGAISEDLPKDASSKSFLRGFRLDLTSGAQGPLNMVRRMPLWGKQLKNYMLENFGHVAGINAAAEMLPYEQNCIELDPEVTDSYGMAVPRISLEWGSNEKQMLSAMEKVIREIYDASGAKQILHLRPSRPGGDAHNMGTCRMGDNPRNSVLNSFCQTHDIPNLFVIDGSCFVTTGIANPSLTIQAIAARASEYIVEEAKKGNL